MQVRILPGPFPLDIRQGIFYNMTGFLSQLFPEVVVAKFALGAVGFCLSPIVGVFCFLKVILYGAFYVVFAATLLPTHIRKYPKHYEDCLGPPFFLFILLLIANAFVALKVSPYVSWEGYQGYEYLWLAAIGTNILSLFYEIGHAKLFGPAKTEEIKKEAEVSLPPDPDNVVSDKKADHYMDFYEKIEKVRELSIGQAIKLKDEVAELIKKGKVSGREASKLYVFIEKRTEELSKA